MKWQLSWFDVLEPVTSEKLVPRSYEYLREVVVTDLMMRSVDCDELDCIAYLESAKRVCEVYPVMQQLHDIRTELARLKKKHRARLQTKRKQLLSQYE